MEVRVMQETGTSRCLWALRHAKSDRSDPSPTDHDRPLAPRGARAADRMGRWAAEMGIRPGLVLCSTALRATQTLERVRPGLGDDVDVKLEPSLYTFDPEAVVERIREIPDDVRSVLIVGHNPAMQGLVVAVASSGERLDAVRRKFPTAAVAGLDLDVASWRDVDEGTGRLSVFVTPRELDTRGEER
jgi:phosphohistidine phosphatase